MERKPRTYTPEFKAEAVEQAFPGHGKLSPYEEELRRLRAEN